MTKKDTRPCGEPYRVLVGLSVRDKAGQLRRLCEAGEVTTRIPACSVGWLLEQGKIEPVKEVKADD